jgi:hypothetical protein
MEIELFLNHKCASGANFLKIARFDRLAADYLIEYAQSNSSGGWPGQKSRAIADGSRIRGEAAGKDEKIQGEALWPPWRERPRAEYCDI